MNLQRYDKYSDEVPAMVPRPEGPYVLATDAAALVAERDELLEIIQFVERMANHHGQKIKGGKLMIPPEDTLSLIQHHPGIEAITKSYSDGKIPETPNPWEELTTLRAQLAEVTRERDEAEAFARKVERGEVKFAKACDENLARIAAMPLGKKLEENLSDAVARVLSERDTALTEVERLRGALERAETSMTRYCNGLHANGSDDMALEVVRKALTAAPVATDEPAQEGGEA